MFPIRPLIWIKAEARKLLKPDTLCQSHREASGRRTTPSACDGHTDGKVREWLRPATL